MTILGASYREVITQNPVSLTVEILPEGCAASWGDTAIVHDWAVCKKSEAVNLANMEVCINNSQSISLGFVSGVASASIQVEGNTLEPYVYYIFTARGNLTIANGSNPLILNNTVSTGVRLLWGSVRQLPWWFRLHYSQGFFGRYF